MGRGFLHLGAFFWNGLNRYSHALLVVGLTGKVCAFAKAAQVNCAVYLSVILQGFGFNGSLGSKSEQALKRRVRLGIYPIGLTALFVLFLILAFLFVSLLHKLT